MTWIPWVLSGLSLLVAVVSLIRVFVVAAQDQSGKTKNELGEVKERVSTLEMKMGMFWRLCEEYLSGMLKKPYHVRMDTLLDKLRDHTLTLPECYELRDQLQENYLNEAAPRAAERIIAILVVGAVESLIQELERQQ